MVLFLLLSLLWNSTSHLYQPGHQRKLAHLQNIPRPQPDFQLTDTPPLGWGLWWWEHIPESIQLNLLIQHTFRVLWNYDEINWIWNLNFTRENLDLIIFMKNISIFTTFLLFPKIATFCKSIFHEKHFYFYPILILHYKKATFYNSYYWGSTDFCLRTKVR